MQARDVMASPVTTCRPNDAAPRPSALCSPRILYSRLLLLLINRRDTLAKQYGSVRKTRNALVTAAEISQPTERRIVQSKQALVVTEANLDKRSILQTLAASSPNRAT
ncbi:hypothetical protein IQ17_06692 [Bradyrhizobium daqingense]|uniref:Uncharacterized protein n=1 Tax=Bradyrhizobium daqingense TaxID=993502 RepID=A0A562KHU7_9BRAD|nr:hypothetical protein IQ17_06692 [Bradyrhizobium daqingense]